jgi:hypothetical protein
MGSLLARRWPLWAVTAMLLVAAVVLTAFAWGRRPPSPSGLTAGTATAEAQQPSRTSPNDDDRAALQKWRSRGSASYLVTETVTCFCPGTSEPVSVSVNQGRPGPQPTGRPAALTVDQLFAKITANRTGQFVAAYDADFGYPVYVRIDPDPEAIDDEITYELTGYQAR